MGLYAMTRDARRKLPRRTKEEDASRKRAWRKAPYSRAVKNVVVEVGRKQAPHLKTANVLRDRERERSQRRRDAANAAAAEAVEATRESDQARERRMEQEALLAAIERALSISDRLKVELDSVGYWDEPLCLTIQAWAASYAAPDGSQEWEDALMAVAIPAATLRLNGFSAARDYRRVGALHTLRYLLPGLSFVAVPGSLDPDPVISVERRAAEGYCVCGCRLPPSQALSEADLRLGGQPLEDQRDRGAVPFCRMHGVRKGPTPYRKRLHASL